MTEREETPPEDGVPYDEVLAEIQAINPAIVELAVTRIRLKRTQEALVRAEADNTGESEVS